MFPGYSSIPDFYSSMWNGYRIQQVGLATSYLALSVNCIVLYFIIGALLGLHLVTE
jgi:hypothetical protein